MKFFLVSEFSHDAKKLLASIYLTSFRKTLWWTPTCYTKDEEDCVMHTEEQRRQRESEGICDKSSMFLHLWNDGVCLTFNVVDTEDTSSNI
jgi:hypothetical protein